MKLFLVGGFLGSGKTTAIQQACTELLNRKIKAGVITNDQGMQLVDSGFIKSFHIPNREVVNGCFCCNYNELDRHIQSLQETDRPDVIFAESVGSCTDLIATVVKPLLQFHPDMGTVLSVFADATILIKISQDGQIYFDESVHYIYQQQLEEADVLVINKIDLLSDKQQENLAQAIKEQYPDKMILYQNSLENKHIRKWLSILNGFTLGERRRSLNMDYAVYGEGEAKMAWLDDEIEIHTTNQTAVGTTIMLINKIFTEIKNEGLPIGHLKFLIRDGYKQKKISFTTTDTDLLKPAPPEVETDDVVLLINARVQATPASLKKIVVDAMNELSIQKACKVVHGKLAVFQPGFPKPTYRILN